MNALYLSAFGDADSLRFGELPVPQPGPGEVLVRVHATALTPSEFQWKPTFATSTGLPRSFPIILGHEFSGVVAVHGGDVGDLALGDAVYGISDWFTNGAQAEYCVAPAAWIAPKPRSLSHGEAATVPISALTAWQALIRRGRLTRGQSVLIHGAAGAVGLCAVQIAREAGAHVIVTATRDHHDLLRTLGAEETIDYREQRFEEVVHDVDVILDTVGGDTLARSWPVLRPGGTLVTIAAASEGTLDRKTRKAFMLVEPKRAQLVETAALIDAGRRRIFVAAEFPFTEAHAAYASAHRRRGLGKTVLRFEPGSAGPAASSLASMPCPGMSAGAGPAPCGGRCLLELIRTRAYQIFESRNGGAGSELDDWLRAEREVQHQLGFQPLCPLKILPLS